MTVGGGKARLDIADQRGARHAGQRVDHQGAPVRAHGHVREHRREDALEHLRRLATGDGQAEEQRRHLRPQGLGETGGAHDLAAGHAGQVGKHQLDAAYVIGLQPA